MYPLDPEQPAPPPDPKRIYVSPHYFWLLSQAMIHLSMDSASYTDFDQFLNNLKDGLHHAQWDTVIELLNQEEVRMLKQP